MDLDLNSWLSQKVSRKSLQHINEGLRYSASTSASAWFWRGFRLRLRARQREAAGAELQSEAALRQMRPEARGRGVGFWLFGVSGGVGRFSEGARGCLAFFGELLKD